MTDPEMQANGAELPPRTAIERKVRFALAIPHTPWKPDRVVSMQRLRDQLSNGMRGGSFPPARAHHDDELDGNYCEFTDREAPHVWAEKIMRWGLASAETHGCTHLLQLQDDVLVAPNFWAALRAMVQAQPDKIIGLETAHPIAPAYASRDDESVRFITTTEGLIGVGWVMPADMVRAFLAWRAHALVDGAIERVTEDTLIGIFAMTVGMRIHHPIPTIIDHDVSLESTYGNDAHVNRRPTVFWHEGPKYGNAWDESDLESPGFWQGLYRRVQDCDPEGRAAPGLFVRAQAMDPEAFEHSVRHVGRFYGPGVVELASKIVKGWSQAKTYAVLADTGEREKRRMAAGRRASLLAKPATDRVLICSPRRGGVHPEYSATCERLIRLVEVETSGDVELLDAWRWHEDVVRVRSRFLQAARATDCTAVHFLDTDVSASPAALLGMLRSGHGIVGTPYPRREGIDFGRVAQGGWEPPEARAYGYPLGVDRESKGFSFDGHECAPVAWIPLGCSVVRREAFEKLIDHYGAIDEKRVELPKSIVELGRLSRQKLETLAARAFGEIERWRAGHMGLRYVDKVNGVDVPTVALFQLLMRGDRLWGEDQSLCYRAADAGVPIFAYFGAGSPATHHGEHAYRGHVESFGLSHETAEQVQRRKENAAADDAKRKALKSDPPTFELASPALDE